jgi:hypothetical protein
VLPEGSSAWRPSDPLIIDIGSPAGQLADEISRLLGASMAIV